MAAAALVAAGGVLMIGRPELGSTAGREMEGRRQHTDDDVWRSAERYGFPDHVAPAAIAGLPGRVTQNHSARRLRCVFTCGEITAVDGRDAERSKETGRDADAAH